MNEYLNQFKGKTINERIVKDCQNYLLEEKLKVNQKNPNEVCLVHVEDPKTKEIISIGGSIPSDLILDQLGFFLQEHFRIPVGGDVITPSVFIAEDGVSHDFKIISANPPAGFNAPAGIKGGRVKIGQGSTPPVRTDFDIETPFVTPPESLTVDVTPPIYDNILGQIQFFTIQQAGGSGTISEIGFFVQWRANVPSVNKNFMLAHDLVSPTVSFIINQTITVNWTWQL